MSAQGQHSPTLMKALLGEETYRDVEAIVTKLVDLEIRGAISHEGHQRVIGELADEIIMQQIANDIVEALPIEPGRPDTPSTETPP